MKETDILKASDSTKFKNSSPGQFLGAPVHADIIKFLKLLVDVLKSKSLCILSNKNINFDKNETELKMENPKHSFRDTNLVLQLI